MPCESSLRRLPPHLQESGARIGGPSNERLQRTRSAALRSPLSFKPLAATEGACVASREPVSRSSLAVGEGQDMNWCRRFRDKPHGTESL
jgi:hypothetical protein